MTSLLSDCILEYMQKQAVSQIGIWYFFIVNKSINIIYTKHVAEMSVHVVAIWSVVWEKYPSKLVYNMKIGFDY